jgi:hypothetical protein
LLFYPFSESFWPERWLPEGPALAKEMGYAFEHAADAYIPFSYGTYMNVHDAFIFQHDDIHNLAF